MNRILVYDGDCSICTRSARVLSAIGWIPSEATVAFGDLTPDLGLEVLEAGIHSEIVTLQLKVPLAGRAAGALMPDDVERTIVGAAAIFSSGTSSRAGFWRLIAATLERTPIPWLITPLYRVFALNRRIIAPARPGITCACDPPFRGGYRIALWVACAVLVGLAACLLALASPAVDPLRASTAVGAAFVASALPALIRLRGERRLEVLAHGAVALAGGGVVLLGFALLAAFGLTGTGTWSSLVLIVPGTWSVFLAARRFVLLGLSPGFTLVFGIALMGGAQVGLLV